MYRAIGLHFNFVSTKYIVVAWYVSENNSPPGSPIQSTHPDLHFAFCILQSAFTCVSFFAVNTALVGLGRAGRGDTMGAAAGPGQYGE